VIWPIVDGQAVHVRGTPDEELRELGVILYLEESGAVTIKLSPWKCPNGKGFK
jgi:hypothetical protein